MKFCCFFCCCFILFVLVRSVFLSFLVFFVFTVTCKRGDTSYVLYSWWCIEVRSIWWHKIFAWGMSVSWFFFFKKYFLSSIPSKYIYPSRILRPPANNPLRALHASAQDKRLWPLCVLHHDRKEQVCLS